MGPSLLKKLASNGFGTSAIACGAVHDSSSTNLATIDKFLIFKGSLGRKTPLLCFLSSEAAVFSHGRGKGGAKFPHFDGTEEEKVCIR